MEFTEGEIIRMAEKFLDKKLPFSNATAQIIVALDGFDKALVDKNYMRVGEHLMDKGASDVLVACSKFDSEKFWEGRKSARDAIREISPIIAAEDVAVPPSRIPELLKGVKKIAGKHSVTIVGFGHIGDGNLHIDLLRNDMDDVQWKSAKSEIIPKILQLAVELDGTITGEHGIGFVKREFLHLGGKDFIIERMRALKDAIDPRGLMNPQKIFI